MKCLDVVWKMNIIIILLLIYTSSPQTEAGFADFLGARQNLGSIFSGLSKQSDDTGDAPSTGATSGSLTDNPATGTNLRTSSSADRTPSSGGPAVLRGPDVTPGSSEELGQIASVPAVLSGKATSNGPYINVIGGAQLGSGPVVRSFQTDGRGPVNNIAGGNNVGSGPRVTSGSSGPVVGGGHKFGQVGNGPRVSAGSSGPAPYAGARYGGPQVSRVDALFNPTVTQLVTIDRFVTLTDQAFQSVAVTLTSLTVQTVTTETRGVGETPVNDRVALQTTVVIKPTSVTLTLVKSDFRLVTDTSLDHVTITHTSYVILQTTFTTTATQVLTYTTTVVRTNINTHRSTVTDYHTVTDTVLARYRGYGTL